MFLGVTATVTNWDAEGTSCSLVLEDNPLVDFVELPDTCQGLQYCNLLSGVIRGALEMVGLLFNCYLHSSFFLYLSCFMSVILSNVVLKLFQNAYSQLPETLTVNMVVLIYLSSEILNIDISECIQPVL